MAGAEKDLGSVALVTGANLINNAGDGRAGQWPHPEHRLRSGVPVRAVHGDLLRLQGVRGERHRALAYEAIAIPDMKTKLSLEALRMSPRFITTDRAWRTYSVSAQPMCVIALIVFAALAIALIALFGLVLRHARRRS
jgi:hypothetical protein